MSKVQFCTEAMELITFEKVFRTFSL